MKHSYPLLDKDLNKLKTLLGRMPYTLERVLALALWNEHCSYRSSKIHLKKLAFPTKRKISGLGEQAGLIDLGQGEQVCFKMESHNHPSFITPYHGAATGVGGILRDIIAMNTRPLALANYLCFGSPKAKGNKARVDGVIRGIGDYGNCMGIPTLTGQTEFLQAYDKNILVNAMALGYLGPGDKPMSAKAQGVGNFVVYAGSSTGRDGILGADMASRAFKKEKQKTTVQIGDPFFGKQLMEASLKAMQKNLIVACQDMGAAGLTCSSFEMAEKGGYGLRLHLDKVPLRDKSMGPEEILLSESQERMLFLCTPSCWDKLKQLFKTYELEICKIGELLNQKEMELYWKKKLILKTDPKFWTSHAPQENRLYKFPPPAKRVLLKEFNVSYKHTKDKNLRPLLFKILSSPEGRSREFVYRQYDQKVGTRTIKDSSYPIGVFKLPSSKRELALAMGARPYLLNIDLEQGAKDAVFYPALQLALRGFEPLAVTDCLNFGNPEKPNIMGEFVLSVDSIAKACKTLDTPIVSGNVSFYNESLSQNIKGTPAILMIGLRDFKNKECEIPSVGFKTPGEKVYLLSSHQFYFQGAVKQFLPFKAQSSSVYGGLQDPLVALFVKELLELSQKALFSSARLVGKFGLAYSLARMVLEHGLGFSLSLNKPLDLWTERLYELLVSVPLDKELSFKTALKNSTLQSKFMGQTVSQKELILGNQRISYSDLKTHYLTPWEADLSL